MFENNISTSEKVDALLPVLFKVVKELPPIEKTRTNKVFRSKYANLDDIKAVIDPILFENGLFFVHLLETREGVPGVHTILYHVDSLQFLASWVGMEAKAANKAQSDIQALGSNITYIKRYAESAILGIVSDEDTDGNRRNQEEQEEEIPYENKVYDRVLEVYAEQFENFGKLRAFMKKHELAVPKNSELAAKLNEKIKEELLDE